MKALSMYILVVLSIVVAFIWSNSLWLARKLQFEQKSMLFGYPWGSATRPPSYYWPEFESYFSHQIWQPEPNEHHHGTQGTQLYHPRVFRKNSGMFIFA
jgi:hypothetical protein